MELNVQRLAELAKIEFTPEEMEDMEADIASVIEAIEPLRELELTGENDMREPVMSIDMLREDIPEKSMETALLVSQSPEGADFSLPKILE